MLQNLADVLIGVVANVKVEPSCLGKGRDLEVETTSYVCFTSSYRGGSLQTRRKGLGCFKGYAKTPNEAYSLGAKEEVANVLGRGLARHPTTAAGPVDVQGTLI